jgi:predicted AAA+ superfamily ATPase
MSPPIFRRQVMDEIEPYLPTGDIVILHGARQVGKTSILMFLQEQLSGQGFITHYIDLEDSRFTAILDRGVDEFLTHLAEEGLPLDSLAQDGRKLFVLIDEIQYLADPSPFLKLIADHHRYLKLIVSGSSSFAMKSKFKDALVGRTVNFEIYPLSYRETLLFRDIPFVEGMRFTDRKVAELVSAYIDYILYGGYPKIVLTADIKMKERYLQQIIDTYVRKDIRDLADIRDIERFNRLLEILAAQSGSLLNVTELCNTCGLTRQTVERYLFLLEQTYILRLVRPFSRNLRAEITKTPKVFFFDTGLMQMLWLKQLQRQALGPAFETSLFAELVKRYGVQQVYFWRTQDKKEIDFILRLPANIWALEAKHSFPRAIPAALPAFASGPLPPSSAPAQIDYRLVGLHGQPGEARMIYPWEITNL